MASLKEGRPYLLMENGACPFTEEVPYFVHFS